MSSRKDAARFSTVAFVSIVYMIVGRLTRSLPLSRPFRLPVCLARVHAARLCETPRRLTQTPYNYSAFVIRSLLSQRRGDFCARGRLKLERGRRNRRPCLA